MFDLRIRYLSFFFGLISILSLLNVIYSYYLIFMIAGGLVGAAYGVSIGEQLMPSDRTKFHQSAQFAMKNTTDGDMMNWINPETGVAGTIKPVRTYYAGQNTMCREFEASIAVQNQVGDANGRACKVGDGVWHLDKRV